MIRGIAADTPGVELILGHSVQALTREPDVGQSGRICGVEMRDPHGHERRLSARLVVGADGRDSRVAQLGGVRTAHVAHGRIAYGAYFEGPSPVGAPNGSAWFLDPNWAAAFPTDGDLTFYAAMPTKDLAARVQAAIPGRTLVRSSQSCPTRRRSSIAHGRLGRRASWTCPTSSTPRPPPAWRSWEMPPVPPTRCGAWVAAWRFNPPNGSPTASLPALARRRVAGAGPEAL